MIDRLGDQLEWGGYFPCSLLDEQGNFVSEFGGIGYAIGLVDNKSLPWSLDFIQHNEEFIDFESLADNKGAWERAFKPIVTDEMIEIINTIIF